MMTIQKNQSRDVRGVLENLIKVEQEAIDVCMAGIKSADSLDCIRELHACLQDHQRHLGKLQNLLNSRDGDHEGDKISCSLDKNWLVQEKMLPASLLRCHRLRSMDS